MNKIFKLSTCGKNKWMSVVVNTSNDKKQVCSVHHGVHKNSYRLCGGWYNASTDACIVKAIWSDVKGFIFYFSKYEQIR